MTETILSNAAITTASSLLIQSSTRQLTQQAPQVTTEPVARIEEYVLLTVFGITIAVLLAAIVVTIRSILNLYK